MGPLSATICAVYDGALFSTYRFHMPMDIRDLFAANLRRLRHEKKMSQEDLAYEADVGRSYLSRIEKGGYYASLRIIERLAGTLKVEPAEFLALPKKRATRRK